LPCIQHIQIFFWRHWGLNSCLPGRCSYHLSHSTSPLSFLLKQIIESNISGYWHIWEFHSVVFLNWKHFINQFIFSVSKHCFHNIISFFLLVQSYAFSIFLNCCAGEYIVAFMKVLSVYRIYYIWIHPLHHSLFFFFHFSFIIHMCIQGLVHFSPLPPPPPLPPTPPPPAPPLNTPQKLFCPYL
jgi:hypothetical protein